MCAETRESWTEDRRHLDMDMLRETRKEQMQ